jgi:uncharacterized integral membrane protein
MRTLGRLLWLCITIILVVFAILFATSNEMTVTVQLWPFESQLTTPLWLALIAAFISGGVIGAILIWGQALATRARLWQLQRQFDRLQAQKAQTAKAESVPQLPHDGL